MQIINRVFGKFVGVFIAPTNVEFLGVICEELLFADLDAKQYGTSYGTHYTMTDAITTFVSPSLVSAVAPATTKPAGTGKKRGRKAWQALEIAF